MSKKPDVLLDALIEGATEKGVGTDVVLYLPGMTVSGTVISERRFFERLSELDSSGNDWTPLTRMILENEQRSRERIRQIYSSAEQSGRNRLTPEEREELDHLKRSRIHLENATILGASQRPIRNELWRGDLHDVMGWFFGQLPDDAC